MCNNSKLSKANAQAALGFWAAAGFPASKLLLGLPLYGYVIKSSSTKMSASLADNVDRMGKHLIPGTFKHEEGDSDLAPAGDLTHLYGQQIGFNQLVSMRALKKQKDGSYVGDNGYKRGMFVADIPAVFLTESPYPQRLGQLQFYPGQSVKNPCGSHHLTRGTVVPV